MISTHFKKVVPQFMHLCYRIKLKKTHNISDKILDMYLQMGQVVLCGMSIPGVTITEIQTMDII